MPTQSVTTDLRPDLQRVIVSILALRNHTRNTGFKTSRGQNEILSTLNGPDLAAVLLALAEAETK